MKTYECGCIAIDDAVQMCMLHAMAPKMLKMLKNVNHALYVVGKPKAVKDAMAGSKELIRLAESN